MDVLLQSDTEISHRMLDLRRQTLGAGTVVGQWPRVLASQPAVQGNSSHELRLLPAFL